MWIVVAARCRGNSPGKMDMIHTSMTTKALTSVMNSASCYSCKLITRLLKVIWGTGHVVTPRGREWTCPLHVLAMQCPLQTSPITRPFIRLIHTGATLFVYVILCWLISLMTSRAVQNLEEIRPCGASGQIDEILTIFRFLFIPLF